ncbi:MAG TPA: segregation/condensation protein A, partial [Methanolinea sp.]|nr:segregation/condensation protein A [Methanolinea sp.]
MAVLCQCEESIEKHGIMTLEELAEMMGKRIIDVYIPLLYLMFEGKLALWQDEFFGQVFVQVWRAEDVPAAIEN